MITDSRATYDAGAESATYQRVKAVHEIQAWAEQIQATSLGCKNLVDSLKRDYLASRVEAAARTLLSHVVQLETALAEATS